MSRVKEDRSKPLKVKYWTFAGILLTDYCQSRCASCYLNLPDAGSSCMDVSTAVRIWRELQDASIHGCRIHLTGGEAFSNWALLINVARKAHSEGLGPLDKVETNGFWAEGEEIIRDRLVALDQAGMNILAISADPFHQEFVPIEHIRRLVAMAGEILGPDRVQVRWKHWLEEGIDIFKLDQSEKDRVFADWIGRGYDRLNGRAAEMLSGFLKLSPPVSFTGECNTPLLRNRHVHVLPTGEVSPGVCAGISIGRTDVGLTIGQLREKLISDHENRPVVGRLAAGGPMLLLELAEKHGFAPAAGYAGKCQLCWSIRNYLISTGEFDDELSPKRMYI